MVFSITGKLSKSGLNFWIIGSKEMSGKCQKCVEAHPGTQSPSAKEILPAIVKTHLVVDSKLLPMSTILLKL